MPFEAIFTISAVITALGVIITAVVAIYRLARKIGDAIGVNDEGKTLAERMARVEHQVWPNGGSSLADQVKQASDIAKETAVEVKFIKQMLLSNNPSYMYVEETETGTVQAIQKPIRTRRKKAS